MMMKRIRHWALVPTLLAFAVSVAAAHASTIALENLQASDGIECRLAEGAYLGLLAPEKGLLLLATRPFPGGEPVGSIEGDRLRFELAGIETSELALSTRHGEPSPVWGMVDRSLDVGRHTGCVSFDQRDFSSEDDLKTYLHWILRDIFFRLGSGVDTEPLALQIGNRTVTVEVTPSGHRSVLVRAREGGLTGLRLDDTEGVYYFQPLILDPDTGKLTVKILRKEGQFFAGSAAEEIAFVVVTSEEPGRTATDPVFEIRCAAIE